MLVRERPSPAPPRRGGEVRESLTPGPRRRGWALLAIVLGRAWRELRKMRTAIILLAILAALAAAGTLLPQIPQNPRAVMLYVQAHPVTAPWFARLGLFDIFGSWLFIAVATLMYVSIGAGLVVRLPAAWRRTQQPAQRSRGLWADWSSIVFHAAFFLLLVGVVYGKAAGFVGNAAIVEGDTFVEARANYDNLDEGLLAHKHAGFEFTVDSFRAAYYPNGTAREFVTRVRIFDRGRLVSTQDVRVNHYVAYGGVKLYQTGYGWAPTVRIEAADGRALTDAPTIFLGDAPFARGVIKAPSAGPPGQQLGVTAWFIPDAQVSGDSIRPGSAELRNPLLLLRVYRGDLHLDRPQNVYALDTAGMEPLWHGALRPGETAVTPEGYRLTFTGVRQYSDLLIKKDPGVPIVFAAFAIGLAALLLSLYLPLLGKEDRVPPLPELDG
jgi:cytochrome c biogenesis protein